jgi:hypothetical protein
MPPPRLPKIMNEFFSSKAVTVYELLQGSDVFYKIPILQRKYVWFEDQIDDRLDDIKESYEKEEPYYFIGGMVFAKEDDVRRIQVIDGQQRLITTILFLHTCQEKLRGFNIIDTAEYYKDLIMKRALNEQGDVTRDFTLALHGGDDIVFRKILNNASDGVRGETPSQEKILAAKSYIENYLETKFPKVEELRKYAQFFLNKVNVVKTEAKDTSIAFTIFETLNDRGARLQPEDLIKNLFLQKANEQDDEVLLNRFDNEWQNFLAQLQKGSGWLVQISTFLKHYIMSHGHYLSKKSIYDWFKDNGPKNVDAADNEIAKLKRSARQYRSYLEGVGNPALRALKIMRFRQAYIVLLACEDLPESVKSNVNYLLESIAFGYTISGSKTNELEREFCKVAEIARQASFTPAKQEEIIAKLREIVDGIKERTLVGLNNYIYTEKSDKRRTLYILSKMSQSLDGAPHDNLTIEHILSKNEAERSQIGNKVVMSLGNLTILPKGDNSSASDSSFAAKRLIYINQPFRITSSLAKPIVTGTQNTRSDKAVSEFAYIPPAPNDPWNETSIKNRQEALVRLAKFTWFS